MSDLQELRETYEKMRRLRTQDGQLLMPHLNAETLKHMTEMLENPPEDFLQLRAWFGVKPDLPKLFQLLRDAYWYVVHHRHPGLH